MNNQVKNTDIAIVGMSCLFPDADNIKEFWNNLAGGVDSIKDIPPDRMDPHFFDYKGEAAIDRFYFKKGGYVNAVKFDPIQYGILPIAAEGLDPEHLIALYLVKKALADAGVYRKNIPVTNCSFILGKGNYIGTAAQKVAEQVQISVMLEAIVNVLLPDIEAEKMKKITTEYTSKLGRFHADTAAGVMPNMVVSLVANRFDMKGPAYTVDAACASSLIAVDHSINLLLSGQCDIALAGGMHLGHTPTFWSIFNIIGAASRKQQIAPFSEDADGVLIGEGAGIVVLKTMEKAIADKDRIYAIIKASSVCSDGSDVSAMAPSFKGQTMTLKLAWEKSGMNPENIGYVETHGTATQVGDRTEIATLKEVFGDNSAPPALLGSVKSNIGHAMPAAGMAGLIKTVLALYHRQIPPTLHCEKPLKSMLDTRFLPAQKLIDWDGKNYPLIAAVNAFGFGGINAHVILEACDKASPEEIEENMPLGRPKGKEIEVISHKVQEQTYEELKQAVNDFMPSKTNVSEYSPLQSEDLDDPILQEVNQNLNGVNRSLHEIVNMQETILKWYRGKNGARQAVPVQKTKSETIVPAALDPNVKRTGTHIERTLRITLDDHPYLLDHAVVRQPENWHNPKDLNPVVPFAMTIELLCENAQALIVGKKVLKFGAAGVMKWIPVTEPFVSKLNGEWKSEDCIAWSIPGYAGGEVTLGNAFPPVPKEYTGDIDLGDSILPRVPTKRELYYLFLFHGYKYQSIIDVVKVTKKGLRAHIRKTEGKGSMMDNLGQLLGLYCHLALDKNQTTFPMGVEEIHFYQDFTEQSGIFEYTLVIREMKDEEAISDVVIKRDDKVWCVVKGWHNRRFDYERSLMDVVIRPREFILAMELAPNVFYYYNALNRASSADFLYERYLNSKEREHYKSLYLNKAREYLISRITTKDTVRKYLETEEKGSLIYPIEICIEHDEKGKPFLSGREEFKGLEISCAHKGSESVAIVSTKPVGIDIEKIEDRDEHFVKLSFTEKELALLQDKSDKAEWLTRFWTAKEAYGKMLGVGLQGNPKQYEIESIGEEKLRIGKTLIQTVKHRDCFIVGWTQNEIDS